MDKQNDTLKILMIGNSHGMDAVQMLNEVFKTADPGRKVMIGALYHSGCRIDQHMDFITNNKGEYIYYKIDQSMSKWTRKPPHVVGEDGKLVSGEQDNGSILCGVTLDCALKDEAWDIITLQQMSVYAAYDKGDFNFDQLHDLITYVKKNATGTPKLYWYDTFTSPNDDTRVATYCGIGYGSRWYKQHLNYFGLSQHTMYNMLVANVEKHIYPLVADGTFAGVIDTATAVQYLQDVLGYAEGKVYRDGVHVSNLGRMMVSYMWYCVFTGRTPSVAHIPDTVPYATTGFNASYQYPAYDENCMFSTGLKQDIITAVTYALNNPLKLPDNTVEAERITYANTKDGVWVCGEVAADLCAANCVGGLAIEKVDTAKDNTVTIVLVDGGEIVLSRKNENAMTVSNIDASVTAICDIEKGSEFIFRAN